MRVRHFLGVALLIGLIGAASGAPAQTAITLQRVAVPAVYTPGQLINVTVTINKSDSRTPTALGIKDTVPGTWRLATQNPFFAADPAMRPAVGRDILNADGSRNFEFAYITTPPFPATFTYRVQTDATESGPMSITGRAVYRFTGAEEQSPLVTTPVTAGSAGEGEPGTGGGGGCAGCNKSAKDLGVTLGDLFVSALALLTLLALARRRG